MAGTNPTALANPAPGQPRGSGGREIHAWFASQVGAEHIASETAVIGLRRWLRRLRPRRVLEMGSGIGTLTYTVLRWAADAEVDVDLTCVEPNGFCREALTRNVAGFPREPRVVVGLAEATPPPEGYDLVVVDGGAADPTIFANVARRGVVFVEGGRPNQRAVLAQGAGSRRWAWACFFSMRRRLAGRKSAYWIYRFEPHVGERVWFAFARVWDRIGYRLKAMGEWLRR